MFNLKDEKCQKRLTQITKNNPKLKKCFTSDKTFPDQCNTLFKTLDDILHQSFRKIRVCKPKVIKSDIQDLMDEKTKLQLSKYNGCLLAKHM